MKIRMCPQCKSTDIELYMGGNLGIQYRCNTCGYIGPLIIEQDITLDGKEKPDVLK